MTKMLVEERRHATERLVAEAEAKGPRWCRSATSEVDGTSTEILRRDCGADASSVIARPLRGLLAERSA
jgi:hypothetical protein